MLVKKNSLINNQVIVEGANIVLFSSANENVVLTTEQFQKNVELLNRGNDSIFVDQIGAGDLYKIKGTFDLSEIKQASGGFVDIVINVEYLYDVIESPVMENYKYSLLKEKAVEELKTLTSQPMNKEEELKEIMERLESERYLSNNEFYQYLSDRQLEPQENLKDVVPAYAVRLLCDNKTPISKSYNIYLQPPVVRQDTRFVLKGWRVVLSISSENKFILYTRNRCVFVNPIVSYYIRRHYTKKEKRVLWSKGKFLGEQSIVKNISVYDYLRSIEETRQYKLKEDSTDYFWKKLANTKYTKKVNLPGKVKHVTWLKKYKKRPKVSVDTKSRGLIKVSANTLLTLMKKGAVLRKFKPMKVPLAFMSSQINRESIPTIQFLNNSTRREHFYDINFIMHIHSINLTFAIINSAKKNMAVNVDVVLESYIQGENEVEVSVINSFSVLLNDSDNFTFQRLFFRTKNLLFKPGDTLSIVLREPEIKATITSGYYMYTPFLNYYTKKEQDFKYHPGKGETFQILDAHTKRSFDPFETAVEELDRLGLIPDFENEESNTLYDPKDIMMEIPTYDEYDENNLNNQDEHQEVDMNDDTL